MADRPEDLTAATQGKGQEHTLWMWIALLAIVIFVTAVRIRLLNVPLERDEGEYAYAGQLILQEIPPYEKAYNMKMPGIYAVYALVLALFGQTSAGVHAGLLVANVATIILLFLLARKLFGRIAAVTSAGAYAVLSLSPSVLGFFAHAEHFIVLAVLAGVLILLKSLESRRLWMFLLSGLLLGCACIIKQHGVALALFAGLYLLWSLVKNHQRQWSKIFSSLAVFCVGVFFPFLVICIILFAAGIFSKFWFWTFVYAREYLAITFLREGLNSFAGTFGSIATPSILIWILSAVGAFALLRHGKTQPHRFFVFSLFVFSFLAVCPGLYFRGQYFVLLLPAVSLLAGIGTASIQKFCADTRRLSALKIIPVIVVAASLIQPVYAQRNYFFTMSPEAVSRKIYGVNPFPESPKIAEFIKEHSQKYDTVAVVGSEPQIYFYSDRRSATGYIYTYAFMEKQPYALRMQKEMINEIEAAKPKFLIFVSVITSWDVKPASGKLIYDWFNEYANKYYRQVGVVYIFPSASTIYLWNQDFSNERPRSYNWIAIFERKS